jgi:hypothetical protein
VIGKRLAKFWVATVSLLLTSLSLTAVTPADALDGSKFDPGLIISDSVFFDFGTMTVDEIQRFLESQVPVCKSSSTGMPCLRNYKADTPAKVADPGKCAAMPAKTNISAAQIIYDISRACGINPRVLLVVLQKEQGLVQATIPSPYMYRAAMGYGCPDSDPGICGKVWTGLFNQVYKAAGQFQWYGDPNGSFTYLKPGRVVSISLHPDSARNCGRKSFTLKSQATANLYYYTPFVPNAAALNNLRGTGDSCSSYGNRNFWRFYWDWFGSPIGGGFLLKSSTSDPYFISNDIKYPITDPELVKDLAPLGPLGEISKEYLDSFKTGITMTKIIKSAPANNLSTYYFVSAGKKYLLANCEQAASMGLDCASAVQLTQVQLDALPTGPYRPDITGVAKTIPVAPAVASYFLVTDKIKIPLDCTKAVTLGFKCEKAVATTATVLDALTTTKLTAVTTGISPLIVNADGTRYLISEGSKHEVLDDVSLVDKGLAVRTPSPLTLSTFSYLPWGSPIAKDGSLFVNRDLKREGVLVDGKYFDIKAETRADVDFTKWFRASTGTLSSVGLSSVTALSPITSFVVDEDSIRWALSDSGWIKVTDNAEWTKQATPITNAALRKLPISELIISGDNFVRAKGQNIIYLLDDGQIRATYNAADREILGVGLTTETTISVAPSALSLIPKSVMIIPAGTVVKNKKTNVVGIVDGGSRMVTIGEASMQLTLPTPRSLTQLQLVGYQNTEVLGSFKVKCDGDVFVVSDSQLHSLPVLTAREYPGRATVLSPEACLLINPSAKEFSQYIGLRTVDAKTKKTSYKAFKVIKGVRYPFKNLADYKLDNTAGLQLNWVSEAFLANLPLGAEIESPGKPVVVEPVAKTYKIIAGDSLISIASKFKTTVAILMRINGINNADRIAVGQIIKLP